MGALRNQYDHLVREALQDLRQEVPGLAFLDRIERVLPPWDTDCTRCPGETCQHRQAEILLVLKDGDVMTAWLDPGDSPDIRAKTPNARAPSVAQISAGW